MHHRKMRIFPYDRFSCLWDRKKMQTQLLFPLPNTHLSLNFKERLLDIFVKNTLKHIQIKCLFSACVLFCSFQGALVHFFFLALDSIK